MRATATKTRKVLSDGARPRPRVEAGTVRHRCKYMDTGEISYRICPLGGHCERCAFAQRIEDYA